VAIPQRAVKVLERCTNAVASLFGVREAEHDHDYNIDLSHQNVLWWLQNTS